jgi:hypothetical protein
MKRMCSFGCKGLVLSDNTRPKGRQLCMAFDAAIILHALARLLL